MSSPINEQILDKLRQTIDSWTGEVTGAHDTLSMQIAETRAELTRLMTLIQQESGGEADTDPDMLAQVGLLQEELEALKTKRKQERHSSQQLRLDYSVIQNKLQMATTALESVLAENEALKQSKPESSSDSSDIAPEISSLMETIAHVTEVHEQTQGQHVRLHQQHRESLARIKSLQDELDGLRGEHDSLTEKHTSLATDHERTMAELDASRTEAGAVERRSHQLQEDQEALQSQVQRLQEQISEKEKEIAGLQESLRNAIPADVESELREENDSLKDELGTLREDFRKQADTLEEHVRRINEFQQREVEFAERESTLREEIGSLKAKLEAATETKSTDLDVREHALVEREQQLQNAAQWVKDIESAALMVQQNLDTMRETMAGQNAAPPEVDIAKEEALEAELDIQKAQNLESQQTIETLRHRIDALESAPPADTSAEEERIRQLEAEVAEQKEINKVQSHEIERLQTDIAEKEEKIEEAPPELNRRTQELQNAQAYIAELQKTVNDQSAELSEMRERENDDGSSAETASPFDAFDENGQQRAIGEILLNADVITETQLFNALVEQDKHPNRRLGSILLEQGLIQEDTVAKVLASQLRLSYIDLDEAEISADALATLNGRSATHHMSLPIRIDNGTLIMAMANPLDQIALEDLERTTGKRIEPIVAPLSDITSAIVRNYGSDFNNDPQPQSREETLQNIDD